MSLDIDCSPYFCNHFYVSENFSRFFKGFSKNAKTFEICSSFYNSVLFKQLSKAFKSFQAKLFLIMEIWENPIFLPPIPSLSFNHNTKSFLHGGIDVCIANIIFHIGIAYFLFVEIKINQQYTGIQCVYMA